MTKSLSMALIGLLLNIFFLQTTTSAGPKEEKLAAKVKVGITKLGIGKESRVKVKLKDNTKITGYVSEITESSFTVTDEKADSVTRIPFTQVEKVKGNNLSKGTAIAITIGLVLAMGVLFAVIWDK